MASVLACLAFVALVAGCMADREDGVVLIGCAVLLFLISFGIAQ